MNPTGYLFFKSKNCNGRHLRHKEVDLVKHSWSLQSWNKALYKYLTLPLIVTWVKIAVKDEFLTPREKNQVIEQERNKNSLFQALCS